ncbi:serine protease 33 isoform X1 [Denticeps clupeoides]|uniref:Peptidase S1 domain-containing protein n=1 Tax=Denticeps clupeoides TaxID=299321 RepID=A0AAY4C2Q7_9TELE|nr:serine protease 33-like isoform X1 [Denticeps clupeoides]
MLGAALVLTWAAAGLWMCSAQTPSCGWQPLRNRIVGGFDSEEGSWPWQVDIQTDVGHICGGTIINENWVLSAAHCFPNPLDTSSYRIYVGRYQLNGMNPFETVYGIRNVVIPRTYVDPQQGHDLALVQLQEPVIYSDRVQPVCLPSSDTQFPPNKMCTITGWGNIRDGVTLSGLGTLQQVDVPLIDSTSCQAMYNTQPTEPIDIGPDMICAGYQEGGKDSCQGDSGGPLVCMTDNGTWVQVGVVSFGLGCAVPNRPGVYAKVSAFSSFIQSSIPDVRLYGSASLTCPGIGVMLTALIIVMTQLQAT